MGSTNPIALLFFFCMSSTEMRFKHVSTPFLIPYLCYQFIECMRRNASTILSSMCGWVSHSNRMRCMYPARVRQEADERQASSQTVVVHVVLLLKDALFFSSPFSISSFFFGMSVPASQRCQH